MVASIVSSWVGLFCSLRVFTESLVHKESLISFPLGIPKPGSNAASVRSAGSTLEEGLCLDSARGDHGTCGPSLASVSSPVKWQSSGTSLAGWLEIGSMELRSMEKARIAFSATSWLCPELCEFTRGSGLGSSGYF